VVFFARVARTVTLVVRGDALERGMSAYLIEQLQQLDNLAVRLCTVVEGAHGVDHLDGVTLRHTPSGAVERIPAGQMFVFIGAQPLTDWLDGVLARDARGFLLT